MLAAAGRAAECHPALVGVSLGVARALLEVDPVRLRSDLFLEVLNHLGLFLGGGLGLLLDGRDVGLDCGNGSQLNRDRGDVLLGTLGGGGRGRLDFRG